MKNLFKINSSACSFGILPFLLVILLATFHRALAQVDYRIDNMIYYRMQLDSGNIPPDTITIPQRILISRALQDGPDVKINGLNPNSESSIFIDPNNRANVLNSNNSWHQSYGPIMGFEDDWVSTNKCVSWSSSSGTSAPSHLNDPKYDFSYPNKGYYTCDPSVAIDRDGNYYIGYLQFDPFTFGDTYYQKIAIKNNSTGLWVFNTVSYQADKSLDKNHLHVDNSVDGNNGFLYNAWTYFGNDPTKKNQIEISRSMDGGDNWSPPYTISTNVNAGQATSNSYACNQGVNLQTGPSGELYAVWAIYDDAYYALGSIHSGKETGLGFANLSDPSFNFTSNFSAAHRIEFNNTYINNGQGGLTSKIMGIRGLMTTKNNIRVNSYPSMAVDVTNTPTRGNIYVVWTNWGNPTDINGTYDEYNVYLIKSTDGGNNWTEPMPINTDAYGSIDKKHFLPWITCDKITGALSVVYYDDRDCTNSQDAEAWVSNSMDAGATWTNFRVSDDRFRPQPLAQNGYFTDYIGIEAQGGDVYPCWNDNRVDDGGYHPHTYVSPYHLCIDHLDIVYPVHAHNFFEAVSYITSTTVINPSYVPINGSITTPSDGHVIFDAGQYILLQEGFETQITDVVGTYFETYINGCEGTISFNSRVSSGSNSQDPISKSLERALDPNLIDRSIQIYPNPNNGIFTVSIKNQKEAFESAEEEEDSEEEKEEYKILVYDVLGKQIYNAIIIEGTPLSIDLTNQPSGLYFVKISEGNKVMSTKIMKQ